MRVIWRLIIIGSIAFILGIMINQVHPRGIRIQHLLLLFPPVYSTQVEKVPADSALILMFEENAIFMDIRSRNQYAIDHIPKAISLPFSEIHVHPSDHFYRTETKPWILYDLQDNSKQIQYVYKKLNTKYQTTILVLEYGFAGWLEKQYPTESGHELE